jgi:hypothetical protein
VGGASSASLASAMTAWAANTAGFQAALQSALTTYAAGAGVASASLPSSLNLAATGAVTSVSASAGTGAATVTTTAGLVGAGSLTVGGAAFSVLLGSRTNLAGIDLIQLTGLGTQVSTTVSDKKMTVSYFDAAFKGWQLDCTSLTCGGTVTIDSAAKSVTFNNVTLLPTEGGATGNVVINGKANYQ